jgi:hypothetical protein
MDFSCCSQKEITVQTVLLNGENVNRGVLCQLKKLYWGALGPVQRNIVL